MKTQLGPYEIVDELGRGGMGVVYKGYEPALARYVAIKELSPTLAHDPLVVERFLREARSMALLNDPHIIQIYSIGQENEQPFFVMEFVDGVSVAALVKRDDHLAPDDALKIVHQSAQGLAAAHNRGVIHRDVKPANLMVSHDGQVKIADFGIALANQDMTAKLTSAGELVGTPGYLSPEILLGNPVDQRSDIYALGVVLFEMLAGRTPFSDASVYKLMLAVVETEVPDVREVNAEIDPGVAAILARMLLKDPARRYQSMRELISDLEKHPLIARGGPIRVKTSIVSGSSETVLGLHTPVTSEGGHRTPTPPPRMGRRQVPAATPVPAPVGNAAAAADTEIRTKLGLSEATPVSSPTPASPKKSRWPLVTAAFLVLLLAAGGWVLRDRLFGTGNPGAQSKPATRYMSTKDHLVTIFVDVQDLGVGKLRPLLHQLGIKVAPELVFDLLLFLLFVIIYRSISNRIYRARARRAYTRRSERAP